MTCWRNASGWASPPLWRPVGIPPESFCGKPSPTPTCFCGTSSIRIPQNTKNGRASPWSPFWKTCIWQTPWAQAFVCDASCCRESMQTQNTTAICDSWHRSFGTARGLSFCPTTPTVAPRQRRQGSHRLPMQSGSPQPNSFRKPGRQCSQKTE